MTRLAFRLYRVFSALNHWASRRLTRGGWLVLVGMCLTGGMATDTEQSLGYQMLALLFALSLSAMAVAPFFRAKFSVERLLPDFGSAGEPLRYRVFIRNRSGKKQAGLFVLDTLADPRPTFAEFAALNRRTGRGGKTLRLTGVPDTRRVLPIKPQSLPILAPGGTADVEIQLMPLRRGVLHFTNVTVARPDPFLLFRALQPVPLPGSITILPRRYPLPRLALPGSTSYQQGGVSFASSIGESEEFVSLRDYRPGDPLRRLHWRSWAKVGRPVVKEFQDEFFVRHALILDTFAGAEDAAVFEEAVSVAASFACTIDTQESLLDLLFIGPQAYCFTIGRGVAHAEQMLELLAAVTPAVEKPFAALEQLVVEHAASVSGCVCIFVAWDEPRRALVHRLEKLGVPLTVLIIRAAGAAALERRPDDPETLHALEVGKMEEGLAKL